MPRLPYRLLAAYKEENTGYGEDGKLSGRLWVFVDVYVARVDVWVLLEHLFDFGPKDGAHPTRGAAEVEEEHVFRLDQIEYFLIGVGIFHHSAIIIYDMYDHVSSCKLSVLIYAEHLSAHTRAGRKGAAYMRGDCR